MARASLHTLKRGTRFRIRKEGPTYIVGEWADGTLSSVQLSGPSAGKIYQWNPTQSVVPIEPLTDRDRGYIRDAIERHAEYIESGANGVDLDLTEERVSNMKKIITRLKDII